MSARMPFIHIQKGFLMREGSHASAAVVLAPAAVAVVVELLLPLLLLLLLQTRLMFSDERWFCTMASMSCVLPLR